MIFSLSKVVVSTCFHRRSPEEQFLEIAFNDESLVGNARAVDRCCSRGVMDGQLAGSTLTSVYLKQWLRALQRGKYLKVLPLARGPESVMLCGRCISLEAEAFISTLFLLNCNQTSAPVRAFVCVCVCVSLREFSPFLRDKLKYLVKYILFPTR